MRICTIRDIKSRMQLAAQTTVYMQTATDQSIQHTESERMSKLWYDMCISVERLCTQRLFGGPEYGPSGNYDDLQVTSYRNVKSGLNSHMTASNEGTLIVINLTTKANKLHCAVFCFYRP
jgi:hypothetical protein